MVDETQDWRKEYENAHASAQECRARLHFHLVKMAMYVMQDIPMGSAFEVEAIKMRRVADEAHEWEALAHRAWSRQYDRI